MIGAHLSALGLTFILYAVLAVAHFGWGAAALRLLRIEQPERRSVALVVWLGWAATLFVLQLLHLFWPLNAATVVPVFVAGAAFALPRLLAAGRGVGFPRWTRRTALAGLVALAAATALAGWIASRSMPTPATYDSYLYHLNKIRWLNSFPAVAGLGNLHGRLAFNQSFFAYVAALNFHPWFGQGRTLANGFLLLLALATVGEALVPVLRRPARLRAAHPLRYLPAAVAGPALLFLAFRSDGLSSPAPDLAGILLQLVLIVELAQGLAEWRAGQTRQDFRAAALLLLATTALTVKLSHLAFAAAIAGFVLAYARATRNGPGAARWLAACAGVLLVWALHGYILSGAPLYPAALGRLPFDWAVPREKMADEANWIFSWARQPGTHWSQVLGSWTWLGGWLRKFSRDVFAVYPLAIAAGFALLAWLGRRAGKGHPPAFLEWALLLPPAAGLAYWFATAPDPRFAYGSFFALPIAAAPLWIWSIRDRLGRRAFGWAVGAAVALANLHFVAPLARRDQPAPAISFSGWHRIQPLPLRTRTTASGLTVYVPKRGDLCGDAPLPATPYFNARLRLRNPNQLSAGFTVAAPAP
ncbi:MAG: hypothetical protein AB7V22_04060 [Kiritimatiellia bacterium]